MSYWYNTATGQVETDENRGQDADVLGPYDSADEASRALQTAHEKSEQWDREDREWDARGATGSGDSED